MISKNRAFIGFLLTSGLALASGCSDDEGQSTSKPAVLEGTAYLSVKFAADKAVTYQGVLDSKYWNLVVSGPSAPMEVSVKDSAGEKASVALMEMSVVDWPPGLGGWANDAENPLMKTYSYYFKEIEFKNMAAGKYRILVYACEGKDRPQSFNLIRRNSDSTIVSESAPQSLSCAAADWNGALKAGVHFLNFDFEISEGQSAVLKTVKGSWSLGGLVNAIQIQKL